jgi:hypothetical protein
MQNQITEDGVTIIIFHESTDPTGFVVREMLRTCNDAMRFQVGRIVMRPMSIPVYKRLTVDGVEELRVSHHREGDDIQKFHLHGVGRTREAALSMASDSLLRQQIKGADRPALTKEDRELLKKYPRHTLEQAREIEATGPTVPKQHHGQELGFVSGFERIVGQERGNYHLSGDHT